ncbi:MAG TPA: GAF domain-containing protein, partial [Anaerolineales bacterium]|nr:GAF domain-containing protein [Anaerolineales bacterium]
MKTNTSQPNSFTNRISQIWETLTRPHKSITDVGEQRTASLASSITLSILTLIVVGFIASTLRGGFANAIGNFGAPMALLPIAYFFSRSRYYKAGIFVFSLAFSAAAYAGIIRLGNSADIPVYIYGFVPISLIVASSFLSPWAVFLLTGLNIGAFLSLSLFGVSLPDNFGALAGVTTTIGVVLIVLTNFRNRIEAYRLEEVKDVNRELENLTSTLEERVATRTDELSARSAELETRSKELEEANSNIRRRASQFEALAQVSHSITSIRNLHELLPHVATVISDYYGFYHVGIFLVDEANEYAFLTATNSKGGQRMLERQHRLKVGEQGIVGSVTGTGEPRIALDVGADATYFNNLDLPETHSEMALPLRSGDKIIGALDVQSKESGAFTDEDVQTLSLLADQVSLAIENDRLFEDSNKTLSELQMVLRQSTREAWKSITKQQGLLGYRYNTIGASPLKEPVKLTNSGNDKGKAREKEAGRIIVPIELRGEVIGNLVVQSPTKDDWNED